MYLKLLAALTFAFLGVTFLVVAQTTPQAVAFNIESTSLPVMQAHCPFDKPYSGPDLKRI
jgi:hypothetical protein